MSQSISAIVVGGGHNGLVAAAYLARAGVSVLVLEQRPFVGGACITEELFPGFRVSSCAYVSHLLQEKVIEELELERHGLEILPVDPFRLHLLPDGQSIRMWHEHERTVEEIRSISPHDADRYGDWAALWDRMCGILYRFFLTEPPTMEEVAASVHGPDDGSAFELMIHGNMKDLVGRFFEHPYIQNAFIDAFDAGDIRAPGSVLTVAYHKCSRFTNPRFVGIPRGGMGSIAEAMVGAAHANGVSIRTGVAVARLEVENGKVKGVRLDSGELIDADVVLSNADPKRTLLSLIDQEVLSPKLVESVRGLKTRFGTLKFHAILNGLPDLSAYLHEGEMVDQFAQIRICPSVDYFEAGWRDVAQGRPSTCPIISIQIPTVLDTSLAPPGRHIMSIWSQFAPVRLAEGTWDEARQRVGEALIESVAQYVPNLREVIDDWILYTPIDLERRVGLTDGNIHHIDVIRSQMFQDRPHRMLAGYRTPIEGLYLCGAGTHPGGEVTGAPGHNAAQVVLRDRA